jgi:glycine/D-amino acid oxidase-like deaminating enzyme
MRRFEGRLGRPVHTNSGLVWRDSAPSLAMIAEAVAVEGVAHTEIPAADVAQFFPGMRPDERDALWFPEAGSLLAADAIAGYLQMFGHNGGRSLFGPEATSVRSTTSGAVVTLDDGHTLESDVAVVCAGPGTSDLLPGIGLDIPLCAFLEQVVHLGRPTQPHLGDALPCLFDGPGEHGPGIYTMPTPGIGYKIGIDDPLRELKPVDIDRTPDPTRTKAIVARADEVLPSPGREVIDEFVCCWTDSLDGWFVIDRADSVVVACGDAGKGFKYAPAIGEILADLAEGGTRDSDFAAMSAQRFEGYDRISDWSPTSLGGAQA